MVQSSEIQVSRGNNGGGSAGGRATEESCGTRGCWDNKDAGEDIGITCGIVVDPDLEAGGIAAREAVCTVALQVCGRLEEIWLKTIIDWFRANENLAE